MALIGPIIKTALNLHDSVSSTTNHVEAQKKVLKNLLKTAKNTSFGLYYDFDGILENNDLEHAFAEAVPFYDYHKMDEQWWSRMKEGKPNITWPGVPKFLARSSGTTGKKSKTIPVTDEMIAAIKAAGTKQVSALTNFDLHDDVFESEVLALGSSTDLSKEDGFTIGEISGISASNIPEFLDSFYRPGKEISSIDDWDERVERIAKEAKNWDIGMLSGIPSWLEMMLKKVMDFHKVDSIHDIWPNLAVYTSGGVAFEPYRSSFEKLFTKPVQIVDTYLASEGFIACQQRPETSSMQLITDGGIYFEFVPFQPEYVEQDGSISNNAPVLSMADVELETDYALIISTVSGAWRYLIGDTIKFTNIDHAEIKITGRTKFFLNVVGSQLSVLKMETAITELQEKYNTSIKEFTVSAKKIDGEFHHVWYLGTETETSEEELATALDDSLQDANKNYKVARTKALKGVQVHKVQPETFSKWNDYNKKKGGQVKMEKVMDEEKFKAWEEFVSSL
ncbi:GH3 auxin-responsive promoter [Nonlabens dokdonensis]|uniref:GH3 auxin-responsive promoter n=2 Tax=Nonlabens dokdonensis TaxID=328515 RepID=A0ABX5PY47_9FLAO|nr:GH3 auxin-responsive promoter family protein [Nonlabens dokdonensis]AGC77293.1 putative auxin-regulated protein [Nonlabens dokdonensis DSW-6]PZX40827.1 GH3 auxin-responsive promoter [Nonlabens dokdonensis]